MRCVGRERWGSHRMWRRPAMWLDLHSGMFPAAAVDKMETPRKLCVPRSRVIHYPPGGACQSLLSLSQVSSACPPPLEGTRWGISSANKCLREGTFWNPGRPQAPSGQFSVVLLGEAFPDWLGTLWKVWSYFSPLCWPASCPCAPTDLCAHMRAHAHMSLSVITTPMDTWTAPPPVSALVRHMTLQVHAR